LLFGLIAWIIAKSVMPRAHDDFLDIVLGIIGSIIAARLPTCFRLRQPDDFIPPEIIFSTLGAILPSSTFA